MRCTEQFVAVESELDWAIRQTRRRGESFLDRGMISKLQSCLVEDGRLHLRLGDDAVLVQTAVVRGLASPVSFVLDGLKPRRRVVIECTTEKMIPLVDAYASDSAILESGEIDAVLRFRGKDIFYNYYDCVCLIARLERTFFSDHGFEIAHYAANASCRYSYLAQVGRSNVAVSWTTDDGEERRRYITVSRRTKNWLRKRRCSVDDIRSLARTASL